MSDEQFGTAIRPGVLDWRDLDGIGAEGDRRDEQALLERIRPHGRLADNLAEFSDDELARVCLHLGDDDMLRVMADMDRRDIDAALLGARRDLVDVQQRTAYTREQHREMYREHTWAQYMNAEDATNGYLLSREARAPASLFSGPAHVAYARASEELRWYWADNPRMMFVSTRRWAPGGAARPPRPPTPPATRRTTGSRG